MTEDAIKVKIQNMSIEDIERLLVEKYKLAEEKAISYPDDIKRSSF